MTLKYILVDYKCLSVHLNPNSEMTCKDALKSDLTGSQNKSTINIIAFNINFKRNTFKFA